MEDLVFKLIDRFDVIDHLPYKMRRVIIDSEIVAVQNLEHFSPDLRCCHQVLSARPLIRSEQHRAVLDRNFHIIFFCQFDDRRPYFFHQFQILFHCLCLVSSDKCCHHADAQFCACKDYIFQMCNCCRSFFQISVHCVRIKCQRRNVYIFLFAVIQNVFRICVIFQHTIHIDVAHTGISSFRFSLRPACNFHTLKSVVCCKIHHFLVGPCVKNCTHKS